MIQKKTTIQKPIRSVIFDLGNVLIRFNAKRAVKRFAKASNTPVPVLWDHFFTSEIEKSYTRGEISSRDFYAHSKKVFGSPLTYKEFSHYWNDIFWENPGMDSLLEKLKTNYPLYLISNTNDLHFKYILQRFKILRHFKKTFPSHKVGHRKPNAEIYLHVLEKIRLKPEETVFVDDMPAFVEAAQKVGMHAVQFKSKQGLVKSLKELGLKV